MENNIYIKQIYNEGLGISFYQKPKNFINKHIHNNLIRKSCLLGLEVLYIIFLVAIIIIVFNLNFPF